MGKINVGRLILGGIVAGIVGDILDYPIDGIWLANAGPNAMASPRGVARILGSTADLVVHADRDLDWHRFDLGVRIDPATLRPGHEDRDLCRRRYLVRFKRCLPNSCRLYVCRRASSHGHLTAYTSLGAFFEIVIGTIVGAALYKED